MTTEATTLITAFEVPPEADQQFVAGWERACEFLAGRDVHRTAALHRALREDADLRFVNVALVNSAQAWRDAVSDPEFPGADMPFNAHAGLYEIVREDGAVGTEGGVVLIDPFEVPENADEQFLAGWDRGRGVVVQQQGHLGARLHRSLTAAGFRFVHIARWSSPLMFARALQRPEFQEAAAAMPFPSHPTLYQVIRD